MGLFMFLYFRRKYKGWEGMEDTVVTWKLLLVIFIQYNTITWSSRMTVIFIDSNWVSLFKTGAFDLNEAIAYPETMEKQETRIDENIAKSPQTLANYFGKPCSGANLRL